jgi:anaerobic magnesium-protoporphyrin IX monomethyl ester cyclase
LILAEDDMRTLLINPPYPISEVPILPMGLSYVGGVLERSGHEVQVLDFLVSRYSKEKIKNKLDEYQPDIIGVTSVTISYPVASDILKYAKSLNKDIITVIGGPHVSFAPIETLTEAPWIDIIVKGEGEMTMLDIVSGKKLADIDGIAYRDKAKSIKQTGERHLIEDLNELPPPAKHLFPLSRYLALDVHASILTGRGCPFNCIFCVGSKMGGRRVRYRNPKLIVDEVEQDLASGFREVNFEDDHLTINHQHLNALCDEIIARGLKFNWSAFSRVDTVNTEILHKMRQAGCTWLLYGVESGNQEILDTIKKKITLQKVRDAVGMAKEAGISILASFIIGLPGETVETLKQTMQFAQGLKTSYGFNVLSPFPGTEVREKAAEYGIEILTNDWTKYDCNRPVTRTKDAGPEAINALLQQYFEEVNRYVAQMEKESRASRGESGKEKKRGPLSTAILKGDVIEGLTMMKEEGNPVEALVNKVAELMPYSRQQIKEDITKWVDKGLLKYTIRDGHLFWNWA